MPRKNLGGERFAAFYLHAFCSSLLPFPENVWRQFFHHLALSLILTPTTTNCGDDVLNILSTPQPLHPFPEHVCRRQPARTRSSLYVYILLSPDAERPPSRLLAHSGVRYEMSGLRKIYGAGRRNSAGSPRGCLSGGGPQFASFWRRARRALAPRRLSGNPRRSIFGGWTIHYKLP